MHLARCVPAGWQLRGCPYLCGCFLRCSSVPYAEDGRRRWELALPWGARGRVPGLDELGIDLFVVGGLDGATPVGHGVGVLVDRCRCWRKGVQGDRSLHNARRSPWADNQRVGQLLLGAESGRPPGRPIPPPQGDVRAEPRTGVFAAAGACGGAGGGGAVPGSARDAWPSVRRWCQKMSVFVQCIVG